MHVAHLCVYLDNRLSPKRRTLQSSVRSTINITSFVLLYSRNDRLQLHAKDVEHQSCPDSVFCKPASFTRCGKL